jgi:RNA polymerase sigma factor (sigma-70 family)
MKIGLPKVLEQLQEAGGGLTDGQLLARFVTSRDEASFVALLRRHGPMVLGVCRRVLRDAHDAEDAFQATFFLLARKASSVVRREAVGCWLYRVAYHAALEAAAANARRRARERQVTDMPHPEVTPAEPPDWRPLLDKELNRLSEKYRSAVVLCDLEGRPRKEAAGLLGVPETTLSSRLSKARKLLALRLAGRGLGLSTAVLTAGLAADTASAQVPTALVDSTARVAALVAAGQMAAASTPAVVLMKGVMQAMLMNKLRLVIGAMMLLAALGGVGFTCRPGDEARAQARPGDEARAQRAPASERVDGKPLSELEALRRENELLKYNLQLVLEKSAAQEKELHALRGRAGVGGTPGPGGSMPGQGGPSRPLGLPGAAPGGAYPPDSEGTPGKPGPLPVPSPPSVPPLPARTVPGFPLKPPAPPPLQDERPLRPPAAEELPPGVKPPGPGSFAGATDDLVSAARLLQEARDEPTQQRLVQALEKALRKVRDELNLPEPGDQRPQ